MQPLERDLKSQVVVEFQEGKMIRIEVQDQSGGWHKYQTVANNPAGIKQALAAALRTQLASKSKKARAVDESTGSVVDMAHG